MKQLIDWDQLADEEMKRLARQERDDATKRWAKYPRPNPFTEAYGQGSTLYKLKGDMYNMELTPLTRKRAAKAFYKIRRNLEDKELMSLRQRLIRAAQAGDQTAQDQIVKAIRYYSHEDMETGL